MDHQRLVDPVTQSHCPACGRPTGDVLCSSCVRRTERYLRDIPKLANDLELTITRQAVGGGFGGKRKKGDEQPLPYNDHASRKQRDVVALLVEWCDHIAADNNVRTLPIMPTVDEYRRRAGAACAIILQHIRWFRVHTDAPDAASAMEWVRDQLRVAVDRPPERVWAGPCMAPIPLSVHEDDGVITVALKASTCDLDLYRKWGQDIIVCDGHNDPDESNGCLAQHPASERAEFLVEHVTEQLLPLRLVWESLYVLLPKCPVAWETARKWPRPRRIEDADGKITVVPPRLVSRAVSAKTHAQLFRGGDILDLARDETKRAGRKRTRHRGDRGKVSA